MKKTLEYLIFISAFLFITCNFVILTWSMWVSKSPSVASHIVAITVAIVMGICFFIWPFLLGLGKGWFRSYWTKAGKLSLWTTQGVWQIYFKRNWIRFLLHALCAGAVLFILYMIGDLIVLDTLSYMVDRLTRAATFSGVFCFAIIVATIIRYALYLRHRYKLPLSKHM